MNNDHGVWSWTSTVSTTSPTVPYAYGRNAPHVADTIFVSQSMRDTLEELYAKALDAETPKKLLSRLPRSAQVASSTAISSPRTQQHRPTMRAPHRRGQGPR